MAAGTGTEEFVAVVGDREIFAPGHFLLKAFDLRISELDDPAAVNTDEVVVVGALDQALVIFLPPSEVVLFDDLLLDQKTQGPVNRGL